MAAAARMARQAAYCGVTPAANMPPSSTAKGTAKKDAVTATSRGAGRSSGGRGLRPRRRAATSMPTQTARK